MIKINAQKAILDQDVRVVILKELYGEESMQDLRIINVNPAHKIYFK